MDHDELLRHVATAPAVPERPERHVRELGMGHHDQAADIPQGVPLQRGRDEQVVQSPKHGIGRAGIAIWASDDLSRHPKLDHELLARNGLDSREKGVRPNHEQDYPIGSDEVLEQRLSRSQRRSHVSRHVSTGSRSRIPAAVLRRAGAGGCVLRASALEFRGDPLRLTREVRTRVLVGGLVDLVQALDQLVDPP